MSTPTKPTTPESAAPRVGPRRRSAERPTPAARRLGYLISIAVNVAMLVIIHVSPGWETASFLTDAAGDVIPLVTASIVAAVVVNVVWLAYDPPWSRALGDLLTAVIGVVAAARVLGVFPFTFAEGSVWPTVVRVALWVAVVGGGIGVVANLVALVRALRATPTP